MEPEMTSTVALVGGTSSFVAVVWLLWRRGHEARPSWWLTASSLDHKTVVILEKEVENEGGDMYECIVCLSEVSPGDEHITLPNCDHGVKFHARCIGFWLKDHSTCPVCRSYIPRPLSQRIHTYVCEHLLEDVISYCNSALDNVANSIADCRDF